MEGLNESNFKQALRDARGLIDAGDLDGAFRFLKRMFAEVTDFGDYLKLTVLIGRFQKAAAQQYGVCPPEYVRAFETPAVRFEAAQTKRKRARRVSGAEARSMKARAQGFALTALAALAILWLLGRLFPLG